MKRIMAIALAACLMIVAAAAWGYWSAGSIDGGNAAAGATTVTQGATPSPTADGGDVSLTWAARTLANGQAVSGYLVKRYDADTLALQSILSACTGVINALTCTENSVPTGSWKWTTTPVIGTNWRGAESAKSSTVDIDVTAPTNSITLSDVTGGTYQDTDTIYYRGVDSGSFTLTNAVSDANSGPASSETTSLAGTSTGWTHTPSTVSTPTGGPYVSESFSWDADTTSGPDEAVTGRDVDGNSAVTNLSFVDDSTAPSAGTISYLDGTQPGNSVPVTFTTGTDDGSGIATRQLQRQSAPLTGGDCGTWSGYTDLGAVNPTSVYADTDVTTATCYMYRYAVTDQVGNQDLTTGTDVSIVDFVPEVITTVAPLGYLENGTPFLDDLVDLADGDSANFTSATVDMTTNYVNGQDTLAFTNQNGITGNWTASTGVMALSGTATVDQYKAALRSITYNNNSNYPNPSTRTVTFVVSDGTNTSNTASRNITITAVNDAPSGADVTKTLDEDTTYAFATADFGMADTVDNGANTLLAVKITTLPVNGLLKLSGVNVTLGQSVSAANITSGLLTYVPVANAAGSPYASFTFQVQDNGGTANSGIDLDASANTFTLNVTPVNDGPVNSVPGSQTTNQDTAKVFSTGNGNLISISDADATGSVQVQLVSTNGATTLSTVSGLLFSVGDGTADATMTFTGTIASINTALAGLSFNPTAGYFGAASLQIVTSDLGGTGSGGTLTDSDTVAITVTGRPIVTATGANLAYTENGSAVLLDSLISVTDADSNITGATVSMTTNYVNGQDTLAFTDQLGITGSWNAATGVLALSGTTTAANYQTAMRSITYVNSSENPATSNRNVNFVTSDAVGAGNTASRQVAVTAVNDAPVNSVPGAQTTDMNQPLVFSTGNGSLISISDVEAGTVQVQLVSTNGATTLFGTMPGSLTFTVGDGTADATMTFSGTKAAVNTALAGLSFNPTAAFTGAASLQVITSDLGATGTGGTLTDNDTVAITVAGRPVTTATVANLAFTENGSGDLLDSLITVTDPDGSVTGATVSMTTNYVNGQDTLAFSTQNGITGVWVPSTGVLTLSGTTTPANYQTALRSITYTNTSDNLSTNNHNVNFVVSDAVGAGNTASRQVAVTAVNDAPVNSVPGTQATSTNTAKVFSTGNFNLVSITDVDAQGGTMQVQLVSTNGATTLFGTMPGSLTFTVGDGTADATMTFTGSFAAVNTALAGLSFNPTNGFTGAASLQIVTADQGNTGTGGTLTDNDTVAITVTGRPVVNATVANLAYTENGSATVLDSLITVTDADGSNTTGATISITTGYVNGQDTLAFTDAGGISGSWNAATGVLTLSGNKTPAQYQTAMRTITYVNGSDNPAAGNRNVNFVASDAGGAGNTSSRQVAVTAVNDAPVNTVPGGQSTNQDTAKVFSSGNSNVISIADVDAGTVQVQLVSTNAATTLFGTMPGSLTFTVGDGTADATMTFSGTTAAVNTALNGLSFNPTAAFSGAASLQVVTSDLGATGTGGTLTDSDTVAVTVINLRPVLTATVANLAYTENGSATALDSSITVTDADGSLTGATVSMTTNYVNGQDTLAFSTQNGISGVWVPSTGVLTLSGTATPAFYQTALRSITYTNTSDNLSTSNRNVNFVASDAVGAGNTASRQIAVTAVNDAPVNSVPGAQTIDQDTAKVFSTGNSNLVSVTDVDAQGGTMQVQLVSTHGATTLSTVAGLLFSVGDGTADATMTFTGTIASINTALAGLSFNPTTAYFGAASLQIVTADQGNTGTGGTLSDNDTVAITVTGRPIVTATVANLAYTENGTAVVLDPLVSVTDADSNVTGATVSMTTNYVNGQDTLAFTNQLGITGSWSAATGVLTLSGTTSPADYQTAMRTITYVNSADNLSTNNHNVNFVVSDAVGAGNTSSRQVAVTAVNDAPVNSVPGTQATTMNTANVFSTGNGNLISITDVDAQGGTMQVQLVSTNGATTLSTLTGLSFSAGDGTADATMTFTGSFAAVNTALNGLSFNPTTSFVGAASLQIVTADQGNTGSGGTLTDNDTVNLNVSGRPVTNTTGANQPYTENGSAVLLDSLISVTDADGSNVTGATVSMTTNYVNGQDTLAFTNQLGITGSWSAATGVLTLSGSTTPADYQTAMRTITYVNSSENPATSNRNVNFAARDAIGFGDTVSRQVAVTAVNDAPANTVPAGQTTAVNTAAVFTGGSLISITDIDAAGGTMQVQLVGTNGATTLSTLTGLSFSVGDGTADATMTFTGSFAAVNTALAGLSFAPRADWVGTAELQIVTSDQGNTGSGGTQTDDDTVDITVTSGLGIFAATAGVGATGGSASYVNPTYTVVGEGTSIGTTDDQFQYLYTTLTGDGMLTANVASITNPCPGTTAIGGVMMRDSLATNSMFAMADQRQVGDNKADQWSRLTTGATAVNANTAATAPEWVRITRSGNSFTTERSANGTTWTALSTAKTIAMGSTIYVGLATSSATDGCNATVSFDNVSLNASPVVTTIAGTTAHTENVPVAVAPAITVTDPDTDNMASGTVTVGSGYTAGQDVLAFTNQNGITGSYSAPTMTLTGSATKANWQTALRSITYNNTSDTPNTGDRTINFVVNDGTNNSNTATKTVSVAAVNDAPVNTVPAGQTAYRNTATVFSNANGNLISVTDDAGSGFIQVQLVSTNGTTTLSTLNSLTFTVGDGTDDATMTFTGTVAKVNSALDKLSFKPTASFTGAASLQIVTSDQGNTGSGGTLTDDDTVGITVTTIGIFDTTAGVGATGGSASYVNPTYTVVGEGASIATTDANDEFQFLYTTWTGDGILTANVASITNPCALTTAIGGVMMRDSLAKNSMFAMADQRQVGVDRADQWSRLTTGAIAVNANTAATAPEWVRITRTGNSFTTERSANGTTWTALSTAKTIAMGSTIYVGLATSSGNNGCNATVTFDNVSLNATPVVTTTGGTTAHTENVPVAVDPAITVTDTNTANMASGTVTVGSGYTAGQDVLAFTNQNGITGSYSAPTMTLTGSATKADWQTALRSITYNNTSDAPNTGARTINFVVNDGTNNSNTAAQTVSVAAVNDAPVNSVPGAQATATSTAKVFSTANGNLISVTDADAAGATMQVQLVSTNGTTTLSSTTGLTFSAGANGTATMTFTGLFAKVNTALAGLSFNPTAGFTGAASLQIVTADQGSTGTGGTLTDNDTVAITVVTAARPVVTATVADLAYAENGSATALDNGITITDADGSNLTGATVSMTTNYVNGQDTLAFTNQLGISGSWSTATGVLTLSGTTTPANYQTAMRTITYVNSSQNPATSNRNVNFVASDAGGASNTSSRQVAVTAVNDAPVITRPAAVSTNINTVKAFTGGNTISIADVDAAGGTMQVQLVSTNGATTMSTRTGLTFTVGDGIADATMTFTGTVAAVNTALATLSFNPTTGFTGAASLQIVTADQGNTGSGGTQTDSEAVAITVG